MKKRTYLLIILLLFIQIGIINAQPIQSIRYVLKTITKTDDILKLKVQKQVFKNGKFLVQGEELLYELPRYTQIGQPSGLVTLNEIYKNLENTHLQINPKEVELIENIHVQEYLNENGAELVVDGIIGENTIIELRKFHLKSLELDITTKIEIEKHFPYRIIDEYFHNNPILIQPFEERLKLFSERFKLETKLLKDVGIIEATDFPNHKANIIKFKSRFELNDINYEIKVIDKKPVIQLNERNFHKYCTEDLVYKRDELQVSLCFSNNNFSLIISGPENTSLTVTCSGEITLTLPKGNNRTESITYFADNSSDDECVEEWQICFSSIGTRLPPVDLDFNFCGISLSSSNLNNLNASVSYGGETFKFLSFGSQ
nr:hypothetical protein [uncultured Draconibacterium sp.]